MNRTPPDPSLPDQFEERVHQLIKDKLNDPLSYPDQMLEWLSQFVTMHVPVNSTTGGGSSTA